MATITISGKCNIVLDDDTEFVDVEDECEDCREWVLCEDDDEEDDPDFDYADVEETEVVVDED